MSWRLGALGITSRLEVMGRQRSVAQHPRGTAARHAVTRPWSSLLIRMTAARLEPGPERHAAIRAAAHTSSPFPPTCCIARRSATSSRSGSIFASSRFETVRPGAGVANARLIGSSRQEELALRRYADLSTRSERDQHAGARVVRPGGRYIAGSWGSPLARRRTADLSTAEAWGRRRRRSARHPCSPGKRRPRFAGPPV
jgi:hypothetical protein